MNMNLEDAIYGRRSIRSYTADKVDKETIKFLLDAAVHAPTAIHEEPWSFVIIQEQKLLKRISDRAKNLICHDLEKGTTEQNKRLWGVVSNPDFNIFYDATTLIAIAVKPMGSFVTADAWLAAENLLLAAYARGLGSCVIGFSVAALNAPDIKQELGIPEGLTVVAPMIIGKARTEAPASPRKKADIICWKE